MTEIKSVLVHERVALLDSPWFESRARPDLLDMQDWGTEETNSAGSLDWIWVRNLNQMNHSHKLSSVMTAL